MNRDTSRSGWDMARLLARAIACSALSLACLAVHGQGAIEPIVPAKPKVYALVAAVGASFHVAVETMRTGSHLPPFRRSSLDAPDHLLNRIVLQALDREIAQTHPDGERIYFSRPAARTVGVSAAQKEEAAIARVVEDLQKMPQRADWHRIVVATPAYKAFEFDGLADKLQGLGIFINPQRGGAATLFDLPSYWDSTHGDDALTPLNKVVRTNVYVAPYSYLAVWVLDPQTLAVMDRQVRLDHQKLADPPSGSLDLVESVGKEFITSQIVAVIGRSIHEALKQTELGGKVEIREVREVKPDEVSNGSRTSR